MGKNLVKRRQEWSWENITKSIESNLQNKGEINLNVTY
jgi:hypothetical protein